MEIPRQFQAIQGGTTTIERTTTNFDGSDDQDGETIGQSAAENRIFSSNADDAGVDLIVSIRTSHEVGLFSVPHSGRRPMLRPCSAHPPPAASSAKVFGYRSAHRLLLAVVVLGLIPLFSAWQLVQQDHRIGDLIMIQHVDRSYVLGPHGPVWEIRTNWSSLRVSSA